MQSFAWAALASLALCGSARAVGACDTTKRASAQHVPGRAGQAPLVIGDSTMLFAAPKLGRLGLEADARGCRQLAAGLEILRARRRAGTLPRTVVLALGANMPIARGQIPEALGILGRARTLVLVTPRRSQVSAAQMHVAARRHPDRVVLADWVAFSSGHDRWFAGDGLHVGDEGATAYARFIRAAVEPFAFPPVRALRLPESAAHATACGIVHPAKGRFEVVVVRGADHVTCERARALTHDGSLRPGNGWRVYDWRAADGPWAWVCARAGGRAVIGLIPARTTPAPRHPTPSGSPLLGDSARSGGASGGQETNSLNFPQVNR